MLAIPSRTVYAGGITRDLSITSRNFAVMRQAKSQFALVLLSLCTLLTSSFGSARADVKLPAIFSDFAVLQRDMPLPVWGWADPGEEVTVSIAGQKHKAKADDKGKWRVTLDPLNVGKPLTLEVLGKNHVTRNDILIGEVWLCSGQSNMEFALQ